MSTYQEKLALLKQQCEVKHEVCNFKLGHLGYVAGAMKQDNLIDIVDNKIFKVGPHVKLSCGQAVSVMVLRLLSGDLPAGFCKIEQWVKTQPINLLLLDTSVEDNYNAINRYVLCDTLDRIADYGPTRFSTEIIAEVLGDRNQEVRSLHIDSTSIHFHGASQEPDLIEMSNKDASADCCLCDDSIAINQGYSRDNHPELAQVNFLGAATKLDGDIRPIMICGSAFSGNENDVSKFKKFCSSDLGELTKLYPNIKTIVLDSAGANPKTLKACKDIGLDVITRLNDNLVKSDLTMLSQDSTVMQTMLVPSKDPSKGEFVKVKYKFLGTQDLTSKDGETITVLKCAFNAESLRPIKTRTHQKRAEKELKQLQNSIKKLQTSPKACEADAIKAFEEITNKVKYCDVSKPQLEHVYGFKGKGRPSKDAVKEVVKVQVYADVAINEDLLNHYIEKELFYVVATTDLNLNIDEEGAKSLYITYHEQSGIEGCWKDLKATGTFIDSIFLEKESRIRALFSLITIALFYQRKLMNVVLKVMERDLISLSPKSVKASFRTSWTTFVEYMKADGPELSFVNRNVQFMNLFNKRSFALLIAIEIGDEAVDFYMPDKYKKNIDLILGARRAIIDDINSMADTLYFQKS